MNAAERSVLAKAYRGDVEAKRLDSPMMRLVQTKSKVAARLADSGLLSVESVTLGGRFPVKITGYALTEAGRVVYCTEVW